MDRPACLPRLPWGGGRPRTRRARKMARRAGRITNGLSAACCPGGADGAMIGAATRQARAAAAPRRGARMARSRLRPLPLLAALALAASAFPADPPPGDPRSVGTPADAELTVTDGGRAFRLNVTVEVDGRPLAAAADDAFDRLFAALDRDRDLVL